MDGLLVDSENNFVETALICIDKYNYNIPEHLLYDIMGCNEKQVRKMFSDTMGKDFDFELFNQRRHEIKKIYNKTHPVLLKKGCLELFDYLNKNNIKKSLATSSNMNVVNEYLSDDLINNFDYIVTGNQINKSKPDPQIYLKAIQPFNLLKEEILAFEDSNNGILSAYNAGLKVIYIPDISKVNDDTKKKAYICLNDLSEAINLIDKLNLIQ